MHAAERGSPEGVQMLLEAGADPDIEDSYGATALAYGIVGRNIEVINMLAPITTASGDHVITRLAQSNLKIEGELEKYLERTTNLASYTNDLSIHHTLNNLDLLNRKRVSFPWNHSLLKISLQPAIKKRMSFLMQKTSLYGNLELLDYLLNRTKYDWRQSDLNNALANAIRTDIVRPVQMIRDYCERNSKNTSIMDTKEQLVKSRGKKEVKKIFGVPQNRFARHSHNILNKIPKNKKWVRRGNLVQQICSMLLASDESEIKSDKLIRYDQLLENLHAKHVHLSGKHFEFEVCPYHCTQKLVCARIRDIKHLIGQILEKVGNEVPIFQNLESLLVGSIREHSRIGEVDETDFILLLDKKFQKFIVFDEVKHCLKVKKIRDSNGKEIALPLELLPFVKPEERENDAYHGYFRSTKYFITFMEQFYSAIDSGSLSLPRGLQLKTKFVPCRVCVKDDYETSVYVRCCHEPGCEEHAKTKDDPSYRETCNCENLTSPCMSWTKIGVVMHLEFNNDDGSVLNFDIDICTPIVPVDKSVNSLGQETDYFDGRNELKRAWLERRRMPGWLPEWNKSMDMSDVSSRYSFRSFRLRFVNTKDVIVEQVNKSKKVYIIIYVSVHCVPCS